MNVGSCQSLKLAILKFSSVTRLELIFCDLSDPFSLLHFFLSLDFQFYFLKFL